MRGIFDLCSLTVGNFNYRKMSLVRDYGALIDEELTSEAFDRVFSLDPRPLDDEAAAVSAREDEWPVVAGDATQSAAVALARTGRSYIIQGPPGTGKSQTITNLIADYVARGKRVLFVCAKRAAIDVVFYRLRQQGLDELCCLIHDSQSDKKGVRPEPQADLREMARRAGRRGGCAETSHRAAATNGETISDSLQRFDAAMRSKPEHVAGSVRELLHRLIELRGHEPKLSASESEQLPSLDVWRTYAELAQRLSTTLAEVADTASLASHPFRWLGDGVIRAEHPLETLHDLAHRAETLLDEVESALGSSGLPGEHWDTIAEIETVVAFAKQVAELAIRGQTRASRCEKHTHQGLGAIGRGPAQMRACR